MTGMVVTFVDGLCVLADPVQKFEDLAQAFAWITALDTEGFGWSAFYPDEADDGYIIVRTHPRRTGVAG